MKFSIPSKQLASALATLKPIAKPNTTHVILGNVCITADKESVTLLAFDLDRQLEITLPAKVKKQGSATIPCNRLADFLEDLDGECVIESSEVTNAGPPSTTEIQNVIRCGSAVAHIAGLPMDEFPPRIAVVEGSEIHMPAKQFNDLLSKSVLNASSDESRATLCSVMIVAWNEKMEIWGADGRRGIICGTDIDMKSGEHIVARESIPSMVKLSTDGEIAICFGENTMSVKAESIEFRTKLIEGTPPRLHQVFPPELGLKIIANRTELDSIAKRAQKGTSEAATFIILECDGKTISASGQKVSKTSGNDFFDMNLDSAKVAKGSSPIKIQVNPQFFRDALKCMTKDEVTIQLIDDISPIVIEEGNVHCCMMPMRIG